MTRIVPELGSRRPAARARRVLVALGLAVLPAAATGEPLPPGLLFVGLQAGSWKLHVAQGDGTLRAVSTPSEPRTPAFSARRGSVAYVSAEGELREVDLASGRDEVLLSPTASQGYTQPTYRPGSDELFLVLLRQRSSVDTDLARVQRGTRSAERLARQRSARFEPAFGEDGRILVYSAVSCAMECGRIIQELWERDLVTEQARQLTLLNGIARQPFRARDGRVYFSSNRAGHYHIWRLASSEEAPTALTSGDVTDESPVVDDAGTVYFIRRRPSGAQLMRLAPAGAPRPVRLPPELVDLRDLRLGR